MVEARTLVSEIKSVISEADFGKFNWESIDLDQGNFEFKMMAFLWFHEDVNLQESKNVQLDIPQALARNPVRIRGEFVRATLEIFLRTRDLGTKLRRSSCVQCVNLPVYREEIWTSGGPRQGDSRLDEQCALPLLSQLVTIGTAWLLNDKRFASSVDIGTSNSFWMVCDAGRHALQPRRRSGPWLFVSMNLNRENGVQCCEWLDDLRHIHTFLHALSLFLRLARDRHLDDFCDECAWVHRVRS